ncbi:MAG: hypothetical protein JWO03_2808 [Bacteroidetes bacterium]|nr:hypothetical protein [Bacteroidota bacterium]
MSFIKKIKQFLGIGTVSVKLAVPASFKVSDSSISGSVNITGKSDQKIKSIDIKMEEIYTKGKGDDKEVTTFELGKVVLNQAFDIKEGEVIAKTFDLPFALLKSTNDHLKEKGGVMGGLGKVGAFLDAEKSEYQIVVSVDVIGAKLDPNDIAKIKKVI